MHPIIYRDTPSPAPIEERAAASAARNAEIALAKRRSYKKTPKQIGEALKEVATEVEAHPEPDDDKDDETYASLYQRCHDDDEKFRCYHLFGRKMTRAEDQREEKSAVTRKKVVTKSIREELDPQDLSDFNQVLLYARKIYRMTSHLSLNQLDHISDETDITVRDLQRVAEKDVQTVLNQLDK